MPEYYIMTDAKREVVSSILERVGYKESPVEEWEIPLFKNKYGMRIGLEKVDEDNFEGYQGTRSNEKTFIEKPRSYLRSEIDSSLMDMMDREFLIETGELEEELDEENMERNMQKDFEVIRDNLGENYRVDSYLINESMKAFLDNLSL